MPLKHAWVLLAVDQYCAKKHANYLCADDQRLVFEPTSALVSYTSIKVAGEACRGKLLISSDYDPEKDATGEVGTYRG